MSSFVAYLSAGSLISIGITVNAQAQAYPVKPVRIILPFTAGGGLDTVMRILAQKVGDSNRQTVVIENRPGASGNIAFEFVAKSEPDGYTLLASTPSIVTNPNIFSKVGYKVDDFTAISLLGKASLLVVVHPSLPARSISELVKLAKAKPGAIRFSSAGTGSSNHLAVEMLRMMAGIDMLHVPYKGGPQALHDVISGQVELTSLSFAETLPQVRANRVRALAQTGDKRSPIALDIPTVEQAGIKGYAASTWYVVFGQARMPSEAVSKIHSEFRRASLLTDVQERLKGAGVGEVIGSTPEQAAQFVREESVRWGKVIRAAGAKLD